MQKLNHHRNIKSYNHVKGIFYPSSSQRGFENLYNAHVSIFRPKVFFFISQTFWAFLCRVKDIGYLFHGLSSAGFSD